MLNYRAFCSKQLFPYLGSAHLLPLLPLRFVLADIVLANVYLHWAVCIKWVRINLQQL
jgi:hypothetical protein